MFSQLADLIERNKVVVAQTTAQLAHQRQLPSYLGYNTEYLAQAFLVTVETLANYLRTGNPEEYRQYTIQLAQRRREQGYSLDDFLVMSELLTTSIQNLIEQHFDGQANAQLRQRYLQRLKGAQTLSQTTVLAIKHSGAAPRSASMTSIPAATLLPEKGSGLGVSSRIGLNSVSSSTDPNLTQFGYAEEPLLKPERLYFDSKEEVIFIDYSDMTLTEPLMLEVLVRVKKIAAGYKQPVYVIICMQNTQIESALAGKFGELSSELLKYVKGIMRYGVTNALTNVTIRSATVQRRLQEGQSHLYPSRQAALEAVRKLRGL